MRLEAMVRTKFVNQGQPVWISSTLIFLSTFFAFLLLSTEAFSQAEVRLHSQGEKFNEHSWGLLIQHEGRPYVIGLAGLILNDKNARAHFYQGERALPMSLIAADWGTGLAIFSPSTSDVSSALPLAINPIQRGEVSIQGEKGNIISVRSERHPYLQHNHVTEISRYPLRKESSGKSVSTGGRHIGILSNHYIEIIPGRGYMIRNLKYQTPNDKTQSYGILISNEQIGDWVKKVLRDPLVPFQFDPQGQENDQEVIQFSSLLWSSNCNEHIDTNHPQNSDDFSIGGPNGFGVGGTEISASACHFRVESARSQSTPSVNHQSPGLEFIRTALSESGKIQTHLTFKDQNLILHAYWSHSLSQFLKRILFEAHLPVLPAQQILTKQAQLLIASENLNVFLQSGVLGNSLFVKRARIILKILGSQNWEMIRVDHMRSLKEAAPTDNVAASVQKIMDMM